MTPDEFRQILAELNMSQRELALHLGVNNVTARRWASGEIPVSHMAKLLLLLMRDNPEARRFIEAQAEKRE